MLQLQRTYLRCISLLLYDGLLRFLTTLGAVHTYVARCCAALLKTHKAFYQRSQATQSACVNGPQFLPRYSSDGLVHRSIAVSRIAARLLRRRCDCSRRMKPRRYRVRVTASDRDLTTRQRADTMAYQVGTCEASRCD